MEYFRGFVHTFEKAAADPFKGVIIETDQSVMEEYDEYAGILADGVVCIDIDDQEKSEVIRDKLKELGVKCRIVRTTRGRHFLFRNPVVEGKEAAEKQATGVPLACMIEADIKRPPNGYLIVKQDGEPREIEQDADDPDYLPGWLWPLSKRKKTENAALAEGEGRNEYLSTHIFALHSRRIPIEDCKIAAEIINEHIFETPLDKKEFEKVTRDKTFKNRSYFTDTGKFLSNDLALDIIEKRKVKRINGVTRIWTGKAYQARSHGGVNLVEKAIHETIPGLTAAQRKEALKKIELNLEDQNEESEEGMIAFNNGVLDLKTWRLSAHSPDRNIVNVIPHNYLPGAPRMSELEEVLLSLADGDNGVMRIMIQAAAYTFLPRSEMRKFFVLTGMKGNGKSTYLSFLMAVYGKENCSAVALEDLSMRFVNAELEGKLANIGDDINDEYITNTSMIKKISAGNEIMVERKGMDPIQFKPYCKLYFSANDIPKMSDKTGAVTDRMIIIPFDHHYDENDSDHKAFIIDELCTEPVIEWFIVLAVRELKELMKTHQFVVPDKSKQMLEEYEIYNNSIKCWLQWFTEEGGQIEGSMGKELFTSYKTFCQDSDCRPVSRTMFTKDLKRMGYSVKLTRIDGKVVRMFYK